MQHGWTVVSAGQCAAVGDRTGRVCVADARVSVAAWSVKRTGGSLQRLLPQFQTMLATTETDRCQRRSDGPTTDIVRHRKQKRRSHDRPRQQKRLSASPALDEFDAGQEREYLLPGLAGRRIQALLNLVPAEHRLVGEAEVHLPEDTGGCARIAVGAVARLVVHAEERLQRVERPRSDLGDELARHAHRAEHGRFDLPAAGLLELEADEAPVEAGVVRDEDAAVQPGWQLGTDDRE